MRKPDTISLSSFVVLCGVLLSLNACMWDDHQQNHPTPNSSNYDSNAANGHSYSNNGSYDDNGAAPPPNNGNQNFGRRE